MAPFRSMRKFSQYAQIRSMRKQAQVGRPLAARLLPCIITGIAVEPFAKQTAPATRTRTLLIMTAIASIFDQEEPRGGARKKFRFWYDSIIDLLLGEPEINQNEIAKRLGRAASTISIVMSTDLFKARYEQRRAEQNKALNEALNTRLAKTTIRALDLMQEKLDTRQVMIPLLELSEMADKNLNRLGFGQKQSGPSVVIQNNAQVVAPVSAEQLAASRQKLIESQSKVIQVESSRSSPIVDSSPGGDAGPEED